MSDKKIRFCVGNEKKHSSLVTIVQNKNDIYILSKERHNQTKLSIHESGQFQNSFTTEYVKESAIVDKKADRHLMKMELLPLSEKCEVVLSYIYPYSEIVLDDEILKKTLWIDAPEENQYVDVTFCKTRTLNNSAPVGYKILCTITLQDESIFIAMYRYMDMNNLIESQLYETKQYVMLDKKNRGATERVCTSVGFEDDLGRRYEMEVYV